MGAASTFPGSQSHQSHEWQGRSSCPSLPANICGAISCSTDHHYPLGNKFAFKAALVVLLYLCAFQRRGSEHHPSFVVSAFGSAVKVDY
ncbi:g5757 [Coccomyxa elongata]